MKWGAIERASYYVPGDERSRTNPGHGYPGGTEYYDRLVQFKDEAEMKAYVKRNQSGYMRTSYRIIRYEEVEVSTEIVVNVKSQIQGGGSKA